MIFPVAECRTTDCQRTGAPYLCWGHRARMRADLAALPRMYGHHPEQRDEIADVLETWFWRSCEGAAPDRLPIYTVSARAVFLAKRLGWINLRPWCVDMAESLRKVGKA